MSRVKVPYRLTAPLRADLVLKGAAQASGQEISRRKLKAVFDEGHVFHNAKVIGASDLVSELTGALEVDFEAWAGLTAPPELAPAVGDPIRLLHDDPELFALDKPSKMPSVPHSAAEIDTAVNHGLAHFPGLTRAFPESLEPGLLHRLDNDTSGVLLFAKSPEVFHEIRSIWKTAQVTKTYRAIVTPSAAARARLEQAPFWIETPLGHDVKSDRRMKAIEKDEDLQRIRGKALPARTHVLEAHDLGDGRIDVTVEIETGVMHQIRVHLASLGCPIAGDPLYGKAVEGTPDSRLWLHAWRIQIARDSGRRMEIEAPLPDLWPGRVVTG